MAKRKSVHSNLYVNQEFSLPAHFTDDTLTHRFYDIFYHFYVKLVSWVSHAPRGTN